MKRALITGITGQDGSYLAECLLEKDYRVFGLVRRSSRCEASSFWHSIDGDMTDEASLHRAVQIAKPDEVYNLAAMSHVGHSFVTPTYTAEVNALGLLHLLQALEQHAPHARIYQASTSELFGNAHEFPQNEKTPFAPRSPYGIAKLYAFWSIVNYREAKRLYACNGILFNHESPRRGESFVSRKITKAVARIALGSKEPLILGNLEAKRDWGYAKDFVQGMWLMLQQEVPTDFVLATGQLHSVRDFVTKAFHVCDIELLWRGEGLKEQGIDAKTGNVLVIVDPQWFRPTEVHALLGDATLARKKLAWKPTIDFAELVSLMVHHDIERLREAEFVH